MQCQIQDFSEGRPVQRLEVLSYYLANFSPKTAGKCKKLDREKGACLQSLPPNRSANDM